MATELTKLLKKIERQTDLMLYVGKDISIQLGQSYFDGADGYYDVIVMVITKNN